MAKSATPEFLDDEKQASLKYSEETENPVFLVENKTDWTLVVKFTFAKLQNYSI